MVDNCQTKQSLVLPKGPHQALGAVWAFLIGAAILLVVSACGQRSSNYEGTELSGEAPDFRLMDQNETFVSLSDFQGKVVVLTFMDSKCEDTCPLTAADMRDAYRQLDQNEANQVVFLGVNVNVEASNAGEVLKATEEWRLDEIPNWHFLTGNRNTLEPVWKDYSIAMVPNPDGNEIVHTPGVYVIDPSGQNRWYISTPYSAEGNVEWTMPLSELLLRHIREILSEN